MNGLLGVILPETDEVENLFTNPSFETIGTDWTGYNSATIALTYDWSRRGIYSTKITPSSGSANSGGYSPQMLLEAATAYYCSFDFKGAAGVAYYAFLYDVTAAAVRGSINWNGSGGPERKSFAVTTVAANNHRLYVVRVASGTSDIFYLDGLQLVKLDHDVDYIDGDQDDCYWTGRRGSSTSKRLANSRAGGRLVDLEDYHFFLESAVGSGMPGVNPLIQETGILPGALDSGEKIPVRLWSLVGTITGSSQSNLHENRQLLIDALKSDRAKNQQPFWLVYTGGNVNNPTRIKAKYRAGLSTGQQVGFSEKLGIQLQSNDPFWYEDGEEGKLLSVYQTLSDADCILKKSYSGAWSEMVGLSDLRKIGQHPVTKDIYVLNSTNLLRWTGSAWTSVLAIVDANDFCFDGYGNAYIVGNFINQGDANGDYIVKFNGSTLSSLGTGLNGIGRTVKIDLLGRIVVGGDFTLAGGVSGTARIAYFDGSWHAYSSGISSGTVYDIAVDHFNNLIIVGSFTNQGDSNGDYVVVWDHTNSAWVSLGTGLNGNGRVAAVDKNNNYIIGGQHTTAGGVTVNYASLWNGSIWSAFGSGFNGQVLDIAFQGDYVYFGGLFDQAGGLDTTDRVALWNGTTFAHLDVDIPGTPTTTKLLVDQDNNLYLGFSTSGSGITGVVNEVINHGTATAWPIITFKCIDVGPVVQYIKNEDTGATIWLDYALQENETLTLDFRLSSRKITSSIFGNVGGVAIFRNSDFSEFNLLPGKNRLSLYVPENAGTVTSLIKWKITHWASDGSAE